MKFAPLIALWFALGVFALSGAELTEILSRTWSDIRE